MGQGGAAHLTQGLALPPIVLPGTHGCDVDIAALPGRSVVAVYPWTGRPGQPNPPHWDDIEGAHGSTPELEGFRDRAERFARMATPIYGLSRQTTDYQRELVERLRLPFPILSDWESRFATALGLPSFITGGETYLKRLTLVVKAGRIETVFYPVPDPGRHAGDVVAWLETQA